MSPILVNASMKPADSFAMARSAASAMEQPTPAAMPLTAATTTTGEAVIDSASRFAASRVSSPGGAPSAPTSAPELKARPAPVSTMTRVPSVAAASTASAVAWMISAVRELSRSGRSKVRRRMPPSRSTRSPSTLTKCPPRIRDKAPTIAIDSLDGVQYRIRRRRPRQRRGRPDRRPRGRPLGRHGRPVREGRRPRRLERDLRRRVLGPPQPPRGGGRDPRLAGGGADLPRLAVPRPHGPRRWPRRSSTTAERPSSGSRT